MTLGASRLTGDTTRFKASYTANLPLLPPSVAPPPPRSTSSFFSRLLRFAVSTSRKAMTTPRTATPTTDRHVYPPPRCSPSLISCPQVRYVYTEDRYAYTEDRYVYTEDRYVYTEDRYVYTEECSGRLSLQTTATLQRLFTSWAPSFRPPHIGFAIVVLGRSPLPAHG